MIQVLIVGGDRSTMVDGMAYDLPKGILFLRFRTSGKWYFNYAVTEPTPGTFVISLGSGLNGVTVTASYLSL